MSYNYNLDATTKLFFFANSKSTQDLVGRLQYIFIYYQLQDFVYRLFYSTSTPVIFYDFLLDLKCVNFKFFRFLFTSYVFTFIYVRFLSIYVEIILIK